MNQLSCGRSACLSSAVPGTVCWPNGFGCSSPSVRVTSERSVAAVSVRCIGIPRVGIHIGLRCTPLTLFCRGTSCTEESLDRSGSNGNERGRDGGDSESGDGDWGTSGSPGGRVPDRSTGLRVSLVSMFFRFDFFGYSLLWIPAAESSYRWEWEYSWNVK